MKLSPETQRKIILEAIIKTDGNREAAAKALTMSLRTLYRHLEKLDMLPELDRLGFTSQPGPPRTGSGGKTATVDAVTMRCIAYIKKHNGEVDYEAITEHLYATKRKEWQPKEWAKQVDKVYKLLDKLQKQGRIRAVGERWQVVR